MIDSGPGVGVLGSIPWTPRPPCGPRTGPRFGSHDLKPTPRRGVPMPVTAMYTKAFRTPVGPATLAPARRRAAFPQNDGSDARSIAVPGLGRPIRVKIASDRDEF